MASQTLMKMIEADSCVHAWVQSFEWLLSQQDKTAFNLVVAIHNPIVLADEDRLLADKLDAFLRNHDSLPIISVMNTIFPGGFYKQGGASALYNDFPKAYEESKSGWGTYAGRIFTPIQMKNGEVMSRVQKIVEKLKRNTQAGGLPMKAAYEADVLDSSYDEDLSTYCAATDADLNRNQPCLAHLSFKLHKGTLSLTAFYRSQYFVTKALGNYLGLGQLLYFVSKEAGLIPGHLICHASMAQIDTKDKDPKWKMADVEQLYASFGPLVYSLSSTVSVLTV